MQQSLVKRAQRKPEPIVVEREYLRIRARRRLRDLVVARGHVDPAAGARARHYDRSSDERITQGWRWWGTKLGTLPALAPIGRRQLRDHREPAGEPVHERLGEPHVGEIEIGSLDAEVVGRPLDAEAAASGVKIEPAVHLVELASEAARRNRDADAHRKIALGENLLGCRATHHHPIHVRFLFSTLAAPIAGSSAVSQAPAARSDMVCGLLNNAE